MSTENHKNELDFTYEGPFNIRIISTLGKYLTDFLETTFETRLSMYRVFIEICQNVALYSIERVWQNKKSTVGYGKVVLTDSADHLTCYTYNKILDCHVDILLQNCENVNKLSMEELLELKEKLRRESSIKDLGAHIGMISIRLFSKNLIKFEIIEKPEENSKYFKITATINKV
jgi:hypothetical protein